MLLQNIRPYLICTVLQPKEELQIHSEVFQQHCFICVNAMDGMLLMNMKAHHLGIWKEASNQGLFEEETE